MPLKDLIKPEPPPSRSGEFTCPHYSPLPRSKRCKDYQDGGTCARETGFVCLEWTKRNAHRLPQRKSSDDDQQGAAIGDVTQEERQPAVDSSPPPRPLERDLFGNPVPVVLEEPPKPKLAPPVVPKATSGTPPTLEVDRLRGFTTEDIASFKALGVEVLLESDTYGELWLVPAYTDKPRKEITPEHAATLMRVLTVFPGSRVVAFEKTGKTQPNNPERPERPSTRSAHEPPAVS